MVLNILYAIGTFPKNTSLDHINDPYRLKSNFIVDKRVIENCLFIISFYILPVFGCIPVL